MADVIRSPICVVVGHVDHGKSSILDFIRNTNIVASEAGAITQAIGASVIPIDVIQKKCCNVAQSLNMKFTIPGLLFIDTPGHAAFSSLRRRGGNLADIAILVIDIEEGIMPQTIESMKILREYKTPFLVAANKIDRIRGYKPSKQTQQQSVLANIGKQDQDFINHFERKMYEIVQKLYENDFPAERFDRVTDFTKEVAIVPTSAILGDGMAELLMVLCALAQKYLEKQLHADIAGPAKGTILEVKEQVGLGLAMDVIIYDGTIKINDTIVIGDLNKPIVTKVRGLFAAGSSTDMRDKKCKYKPIDKASAATGVRISAPNLEGVMSGMPIAVAKENAVEQTIASIQEEIEDANIQTDTKGVIVKADTIGSLEALTALLREEQIPVRMATVGEINKKDILEAQSNNQTNPIFAIILGFNIKPAPSTKEVKIIVAPVIYHLVDEFKIWKEAKEKEKLALKAKHLPKLSKLQFLKGCSFRQSNPAVIGVQILLGEATPGTHLIKSDGSNAGQIKSLEHNKESISSATKEMQVACAIDGVTIGRQINENDIFYSKISEQEFLELKENKALLNEQTKEILREIADIHRKENPVWGL